LYVTINKIKEKNDWEAAYYSRLIAEQEQENNNGHVIT